VRHPVRRLLGEGTAAEAGTKIRLRIAAAASRISVRGGLSGLAKNPPIDAAPASAVCAMRGARLGYAAF
jgi:hypothetical protein